ncbi:MAG: C1 family peptidase [Pararhodobacter sp.]
MGTPGLFGAAAPAQGVLTCFASAEYQAVLASEGACCGDSIRLDATVDGWPPRDQRYRSTCVAYAAVAAMELFWRLNGRTVDLSADYLYHKMRTALDPALIAEYRRSVPGYASGATLLEQAKRVFEAFGCCTIDDRPSGGSLAVKSLTGPAARSGEDEAAARWKHPAFFHARIEDPAQRQPLAVPGFAPTRSMSVTLHRLLSMGSPVAIGLPVYRLGGGWDNWTTAHARRFGTVAYPACPCDSGAILPVRPETTGRPVESVGHAVCVLGYTPDEKAPGKGWFVFRNSWGLDFRTAWAPRSKTSPDAGQGRISALAVDRYVWEALAPLKPVQTASGA